MAENRILIKFEGKGDKPLIAAINKLAKAQRGLNNTIDDSTKKTKGAAMGNRLLANSFATIRAKLLLVSFAMSMGVKQLIEFTKQSAKVSDMTRAFNTLSESVEGGEVGLQKLRDATNGTMSQFDLFQQANNAMILGVTRNTDEMAEMFDMAQRLGRALGRDTASSVESLITGIGRQSRLMLDNIGIIVKADEAYGSYAKKLGTTADKLSDSEKKQAFLQATMASARAKVADLGDETTTTTDAFDRFAASSTELADRIGEKLQSPTGKLLNLFSDWVDSTREVSFAQAFQTKNIEIANKFIKQARREIYNLRLANSDGAESFKTLSNALPQVRERVVLLEAQIRNIKVQSGQLVPVLDEMSDEWLKANSSIEESIDPMGESAEVALLLTNSLKKLIAVAKSKEEKGFLNDALFGDKTPEEFLTSIKTLNPELSDFIVKVDKLGKITTLNFGEYEGATFFEKMFGGSAEEIERVTEQGIFVAQTLSNSFSGLSDSMSNSMNVRLRNEMKTLKDSEEYQRASNKKKKAMEKDLNDSYAKERTRVAEFEKISNIANAGINIATSLTNPKVLTNPVLFSIVAALGAAQMATIIGTPIPKYATGGMVGGRRHSAGGTMIEAEQGEFIMSRNAVNAVGVEAMNRINAGGGAGAINISFEGNVMSQDFIEDEAIPMIKEAIRRGADIGVA